MDSTDTRLTPEQEAAYLQWRASLPAALQSTGDYDLRGAYKAQAQPSADAHLTDQFKKPNHPTFSNESQYAPLAPHLAGTWEGEKYNPTMLRKLSGLLRGR